MYLAASITCFTGIALAILGYQLGRRPGILARPALPAGLRFTAEETTAVAAATRFYGLITITVGLALAMTQAAIG